MMTPRTTRYPPPISSASAETSPIHPPMLPRNISESGTSGSAGITMLWRGVAAVTTSAEPRSRGTDAPGAAKRVMDAGNSNSSRARAASAGLKMFWPRPPKAAFTTMTANTAPTAAIQ